MYIDDCLRALFEVMVAPGEELSCRFATSTGLWTVWPYDYISNRTYNVAAMSFTPSELFEAVKKRVPELEIEYKPDGRQKIGKKWEMSALHLLHSTHCSFNV